MNILDNFNNDINRVATITIACCVLHNFCEIYSEQVLLLEDVAQYYDLIVGVRGDAMRLAGHGWVDKIA